MYVAALKKKIRIEDLLHSSGPYQSSQSITSSLMNLVMQFRKVCATKTPRITMSDIGHIRHSLVKLLFRVNPLGVKGLLKIEF